MFEEKFVLRKYQFGLRRFFRKVPSKIGLLSAIKAINKDIKANENFADNHVHNILMVEQIFLSPQVKRNVIIRKKLVYERCLMSCRST